MKIDLGAKGLDSGHETVLHTSSGVGVARWARDLDQTTRAHNKPSRLTGHLVAIYLTQSLLLHLCPDK